MIGIDGVAHVAPPIAPERDEVEVMARRLCEAAGWNPDAMGHLAMSHNIATPRGIFHVYGCEPMPHWHCYADMAREFLAPTRARSAASELDSEEASTP